MLGTKAKNYKEIFHNLQENVLQYAVVNYKKGVNLLPLNRELEDVDISRKEPGPTTGPGIKGAFDKANKRYKIQF